MEPPEPVNEADAPQARAVLDQTPVAVGDVINLCPQIEVTVHKLIQRLGYPAAEQRSRPSRATSAMALMVSTTTGSPLSHRARTSLCT